MARKVGIRWKVPPSTLGRAVERYGQNLLVRVAAEMAYFADQVLKPDAQRTAPWTDRTGNARSGIFTVTDAGRSFVTTYLSHGVVIAYGVYLELAHGGKYAIIMPTIERNLPELKARLEKVLK